MTLAEFSCRIRGVLNNLLDPKVMFQHLLSKRGLSLDRLHVLLELEAAGSLSKAAGGDEVRQSQYSRQLKQLGEYFGVPVAERQGRELKVTAAGKRLALLARESFTGLDEFQRANANQPISVTIGAGDSILQWLVLPRLGEIQRKFSNAQITLSNLRGAQIAEGLENMKLEFGLLREGQVPPRYKKERVVQLRYSIFVPRGLLPGGKKDHRQVLQKVPLVRHNPTGELAERQARLAREEGLELNHRLTCESFPQACRAVQSGHYAAVLPTIAAGDLKKGEFEEVEWPGLKAESRWIMLACNPRLIRLRPDLEKVMGTLGAGLKQPPGA